MKKFGIFLFIITIPLLAGCAPSAPVQITELSEIVGTWKSDPPFMVARISQDGTTFTALTMTRLNQGDYQVSNFSFEDDLLSVTGLMCRDDKEGSYEVHLLPSGNLEFTLAKDDCTERTYILVSQTVEPVIHVEWIRVE